MLHVDVYDEREEREGCGNGYWFPSFFSFVDTSRNRAFDPDSFLFYVGDVIDM